MSLIVIPNTFSAGAVIIASQHNSNFSTIYSDYNGNIDNNNIASGAAIAYSKLNLTGNIVNADINASAAIVGSKIDLTSPGSIGSTAPNTGAFTTLKVGTTHQGDVLYDNGTSFTRLTPGTSGQVLTTQGAAANPQWASPGSLILISTTSISGATNSGDIVITNTKLYYVVIRITTFGTPDIVGIRFNNDTGSHYTHVSRGFDTGASASNNNSTGTTSISTSATATLGGNDNDYGFYIYPQSGNGTLGITVAGKSIAANNATGNLCFWDFLGGWNNSAAATSFRIITVGSNNMTGTVYLYNISLT